MPDVELQQVGLYTITGLLRTGSTSSLYSGRQQQRRKDVLIKLLHTPLTTNEAKEAFLSRARQLKKLKHRNISEIQDFGIITEAGPHRDCSYLVMQFVPGTTLRQRIAPGQRISPEEVKRTLSPVADALHYAHITNVLHSNLHPGTLLISERNETLLTDFSLPLPGVLPSSEEEIAAIPYRAPEHLRGTPMPASDQYALAIIVYELLCGQRPYQATEPETLLYQQEHSTFPLPSSLNTNISPAVEKVLIQALALAPDERFPHIRAFADAYLYSLMGLPVKVETQRTPLSQSTSTADNGNVGAQFIAPTPIAPTSVVPTPVAPLPIVSTPIVPISATPADGNGTTDTMHPAQTPMFVNASFSTPVTNNSTPRPNTAYRAPTPTFVSDDRLQEIVSADLCQGGILSTSLPGYEERPAQIEMAQLVARSLTESTPTIVEAATGTGKSLAYLVPIVRSGKVAIISTANKALQEQLFYKDIPFVQKHIKHFEAALVKGMGNYVCLDRLSNENIGLQFYAKNREFTRLLKITEEDTTFSGDFETLEFPLPGDIRAGVSADSDQCAWSKCNFYADCYVRKMRIRAEHAQIIVVNHTLLLLDAAMEGNLLPEHDVIVIDEAHHLEEEATRAFTITITPNQVATLLSQRMLKEHSAPDLQDKVKQAQVDAWNRLRVEANPGPKNRVNLQTPLQEGLLLATALANLADSLRQQRPQDMPEKESQLYDKLLKRTQNLSENVRMVFAVNQPEKFIYYVERVNAPGQRGDQLQVSASPLDITSWLKEFLFDQSTVICTSATLATIGPNPAKPEDKGPNFAYFRRRVGLDPIEHPDILERILPLTFDYESNALLYLPRDLPEPAYGEGPQVNAYTKAIARQMYHLVKASRGRAFLLFSSKRMLENVYDLLVPHLKFPLLRQGDLPRIELTRKFREEGAVLFGLKSFWEGVDIPGEALSLVVIDKLPFDPPDDPVHEARVARMKAANENWFGTYVLPQAVLRLKQGLGRLLRTREDRGVMAILDTRLHTKGYGKLVLSGLPPARRTASLKDVELFFAEEQEPF